MKDMQDCNQSLSVLIKFIFKKNVSQQQSIISYKLISTDSKLFQEFQTRRKHESIDKSSMFLKSLACSFKYSQSSKHDQF